MNYVLKIEPNGNVTKIERPEKADFRWMAKEIGCEWIELVRPRGYDYCLVIDEEGLFHDLSVNRLASLMYGIERHGQPIVGTALLMKEGLVNGEPDLVGMTADETAEASRMLLKLNDGR